MSKNLSLINNKIKEAASQRDFWIDELDKWCEQRAAEMQKLKNEMENIP